VAGSNADCGLALHEGDDIGNSSDAVGTSRKAFRYPLRNRVVQDDATGNEPLSDGPRAQLACCIPDVDHAWFAIKEPIHHGRHCVVRFNTFCRFCARVLSKPDAQHRFWSISFCVSQLYFQHCVVSIRIFLFSVLANLHCSCLCKTVHYMVFTGAQRQRRLDPSSTKGVGRS